MTYHHRFLVAVAAATASASLATAGLAQQAPAGMDPARRAEAQKRWADMRAQRLEARARSLHDILMLRPDQEAAFRTYLESVQPRPRGRDREAADGGGAGAPPLTTPQRLDRMAAAMAERQARFQQRAAATRQFYAALSPEQQRSFDAVSKLAMRRDEHRGERHGGPGSLQHPRDNG